MRLIDADALRDNLQALAYDDWNQGVTTSWADAYSEVADMVEEMPTIEERKTWQWIPCSERYPNPDDRVLVITNTADYYVWDWLSFGVDNYLWEDESGYFHDKYEVIAWMPLPEYKGEQE